MQLTSGLKFLVLGLSAISVAEATFVNINHVGRDGRAVQRRQDDEEESSKDTDVATTSSTPPPEVETTTTKESSSTQPTPTVSSTPIQTPTSSSVKPPASTSSSSQNDTPATSSTPPPESSSNTPEESSSETQKPESSVSLEVSTITQVKTITEADGSQKTVTSEIVTSATAGLASNNGNPQQESGMSTQTRNTVIGVVVGVGGAIILGGLAFVAWRIWGRKRNQEENDVLMDYGNQAETAEPAGSMAGRTPFQSTLESYHAPTQVNTAANF
ncbi:hypothetical protein BT67DRAFT_241598 [Trichocladium antarcticum]|uniref:Mid2 domain-containing protein n=1 Tax=Trichocladium antarcticum TaxID=1450529 RepID=A0AAN6UBT4_9PEZI|nr:hypothetical protein BT67DRAFT_241598 [Trichocladium antarcticum]